MVKSSFNKAWLKFYNENKEPKEINDIHVLDYHDFQNKVRKDDEDFAFDVVEKFLKETHLY